MTLHVRSPVIGDDIDLVIFTRVNLVVSDELDIPGRYAFKHDNHSNFSVATEQRGTAAQDLAPSARFVFTAGLSNLVAAGNRIVSCRSHNGTQRSQLYHAAIDGSGRLHLKQGGTSLGNGSFTITQGTRYLAQLSAPYGASVTVEARLYDETGTTLLDSVSVTENTTGGGAGNAEFSCGLAGAPSGAVTAYFWDWAANDDGTFVDPTRKAWAIDPVGAGTDVGTGAGTFEDIDDFRLVDAFSDDFDRANDPDDVGTSSSGHVWSDADLFGILDAEFYRSDGSSGADAYANFHFGASSHLGQVVLRQAPASGEFAYIAIRRVDDSNMVRLRVAPLGGSYQLQTVTAGVVADVGAAFGVVAADDQINWAAADDQYALAINFGGDVLRSTAAHQNGKSVALGTSGDTATRFAAFTVTAFLNTNAFDTDDVAVVDVSERRSFAIANPLSATGLVVEQVGLYGYLTSPTGTARLYQFDGTTRVETIDISPAGADEIRLLSRDLAPGGGAWSHAELELLELGVSETSGVDDITVYGLAAYVWATGTAATAPTGVSGSGAATLAAFTSSGAGAVDVRGSGSGTISAMAAAGVATIRIAGAGAATLASLSAAGSGIVAISGAGSAVLASLVAAGSVTIDVGGDGSALLAALVASGEGSVGASGSITGSGAAHLAALLAAGSGTIRVTGLGDAQLGALAAAGIGRVAIDAEGAAMLAAVQASGAGTVLVRGDGVALLAALEAAGAGIAGDAFRRRITVQLLIT